MNQRRSAAPMNETTLVLGAVLAVSLGGQAATYWVTRAQNRTPGLILLLVALAAGTMAGEAVLHAIPESMEAWEGRTLGLGGLVAAGFIGLMLLTSFVKHRACCDPAQGGAHSMAWSSIAGDAVCNFADGLAIAASFLISVPLGIATTVAIVLHELPQEAGQCAILLRAGMSPRRALAWNAASAAPALLGASLVLALPTGAGLERFLLPIVAGAFLHIAFADLVPAIRRAAGGFNAPRRAAFATGLVIMAAILLLE